LLKNVNKDFKGAIADFNKVISINPKYVNAYINRSISKIGLEQYQAAISDCNFVLKLDSNFKEAYNNRGSIYMNNLNDFKSAILDFTKAIEISKNKPDNVLYFNRAGSKYELEDYIGCIEDCNIAIEIDPKFIGSYVERGRAKLMLGQNESACADFSKAVSLGYIDTIGIIQNNCKHP
jgi:tetratricopeptide (TPR) repeat protein